MLRDVDVEWVFSARIISSRCFALLIVKSRKHALRVIVIPNDGD